MFVWTLDFWFQSKMHSIPSCLEITTVSHDPQEVPIATLGISELHPHVEPNELPIN